MLFFMLLLLALAQSFLYRYLCLHNADKDSTGVKPIKKRFWFTFNSLWLLCILLLQLYQNLHTSHFANETPSTVIHVGTM